MVRRILGGEESLPELEVVDGRLGHIRAEVPAELRGHATDRALGSPSPRRNSAWRRRAEEVPDPGSRGSCGLPQWIGSSRVACVDRVGVLFDRRIGVELLEHVAGEVLCYSFVLEMECAHRAAPRIRPAGTPAAILELISTLYVAWDRGAMAEPCGRLSGKQHVRSRIPA